MISKFKINIWFVFVPTFKALLKDNDLFDVEIDKSLQSKYFYNFYNETVFSAK